MTNISPGETVRCLRQRLPEQRAALGFRYTYRGWARATSCPYPSISPSDDSERARPVVISTNDIKNGTVLNLDGQLWTVIWFQHHKPGKGNTVVRTKLKHVLSGKVVDRTFNSDVKIESAEVDRRDMQYLYQDGDTYIFMDESTYEQLPIPTEVVGDAKDFMLENQTATVALHEVTRSTLICRPRLSWRSPTPNLACRATAPLVALSLRPSRLVVRSRCRCSSLRVKRSRSTPVPAITSAASPRSEYEYRSHP